jgi:TANK-binding kinase 1
MHQNRQVYILKLLVMEYCNGGSLSSLLDQPENIYGLEQREFLLVLKHICTRVSLFNNNNNNNNKTSTISFFIFFIYSSFNKINKKHKKAAGMNELHELKIVHRDIKPNNILLQILPTGEHVYKLSDFGAARSLEEDDQFTSICGTEEYLFPGKGFSFLFIHLFYVSSF